MELKVDSLTKRYGSVTAADDVSFEVEKGGFATLLGPSGSGKTTVLRCIAGVETPDAGIVKIGGRTVFSKEERINLPPEQRGVGMVYQSYALWPHMTVFENVAYPLKIRGASDETGERVESVLRMLNISTMAKRYPHQLSGGEQQRVAFARALVYDPELLLLDEPFSNLDTPLRERLRDELQMVQRETGVTTVYVTHHRVEAASMSDKIVLLSQGKVNAVGTPSDLLERPPNSLVASFLAGFLVLDGVAHLADDGRITIATSSGRLELNEETKASEGDRVRIYVKPRYTRLAQGNGGKNRLKGRVVGITREADSVAFHVAVDEQRIEVPHPIQSGWTPMIGSEIFVEAPPSACILADKEK